MKKSLWLHCQGTYMSCSPGHTYKLFTINASATELSAAATSDIHFMAVEDLLHPLPQSPSPLLSFTIQLHLWCYYNSFQHKTNHIKLIALVRTTQPAEWLRRDRLYQSDRRKRWLCVCVCVLLLPGFLVWANQWWWSFLIYCDSRAQHRAFQLSQD